MKGMLITEVQQSRRECASSMRSWTEENPSRRIVRFQSSNGGLTGALGVDTTSCHLTGRRRSRTRRRAQPGTNTDG